MPKPWRKWRRLPTRLQGSRDGRRGRPPADPMPPDTEPFGLGGGWTCCVEEGHYGHRVAAGVLLPAPRQRGSRAPGFAAGALDRREPADRGARGRAAPAAAGRERAHRALVRASERTGRCASRAAVHYGEVAIPSEDCFFEVHVGTGVVLATHSDRGGQAFPATRFRMVTDKCAG